MKNQKDVSFILDKELTGLLTGGFGEGDVKEVSRMILRCLASTLEQMSLITEQRILQGNEGCADGRRETQS